MSIFITKEGKFRFLPRIKISALHLYCQIGRIYAIEEDINKLSKIGKDYGQAGKI